MLVIRVKGIIDLKRMKELVKIYKEALGEQPFVIIDDEVREIEPFYDYRESNQTEQQEITYNADLINLTNLPKYEEKLQDGIVPLIFEEGKVADLEVKNGEITGVHPGGTIEDFEKLMNSGKVEITQDGGKPLGE